MIKFIHILKTLSMYLFVKNQALIYVEIVVEMVQNGLLTQHYCLVPKFIETYIAIKILENKMKNIFY
jgi:hypothetical protein